MSKKMYKRILREHKVFCEPTRKTKDGVQLYRLYQRRGLDKVPV